jgi:hypothetical protein
MRASRVRGPLSALALAAFAILPLGCGTTHQGREPIESGFLGDYSQLRKGTGDEAQLVYWKPGVDFRKYDKMLLEPIHVRCTPEKSWFRDASDEELKALLDYFDAAIRKNLEDEFEFVERPGPGVLRLRIALTEMMGANVARDILSSAIPQPLALSTLKRVVLNKATGVGEAAVEMELVDSVTKERLAAGVDKRIGEKFTGKFDKFDQWRAPKAAFDYWAMRMKVRAIESRGGPETD